MTYKDSASRYRLHGMGEIPNLAIALHEMTATRLQVSRKLENSLLNSTVKIKVKVSWNFRLLEAVLNEFLKFRGYNNSREWLDVRGEWWALSCWIHFSIFINFITLLDTIFYRKSIEVTSEWWVLRGELYLKFQNWQFKF